MTGVGWFMEPWVGPVEFGYSAEVHDTATGQVVKWDDTARMWRCAACLMRSPGHHTFCAQA